MLDEQDRASGELRKHRRLPPWSGCEGGGCGRRGRLVLKGPRARRLRACVFDYLESSSVPGVKYLGAGFPCFHRLFWFASLTVAVALWGLLVMDAWEKWQDSPTIIAMDMKYRPVSQVPFPAITICVPGNIDYAAFAYPTELRKFEEKLRQNSYNETAEMEEFDLLRDLSWICNKNFSRWTDTTIDNMRKFMDSKRIRPADGTDLANDQDLVLESGICKVYNSLPGSQLFSKGTFHSHHNFIDVINKTVTWSVDNGYEKSRGREIYPLQGDRSGELTFEIHARQARKCVKTVQTAKVFLTSPADVANPTIEPLVVPVSGVTTVRVTPHVVQTEHALRQRYTPDQRLCFFADERPLRFFRFYSEGLCEYECLVNFTLSRCGCVSFFMPRALDTPVCEGKKRSCPKKKSNKFRGGAPKKVADSCNCLPSCWSIEYTAEVTSDTESESKELIIKFAKHNYLPRYRKELFGTIDFLANCGGILGLFIGANLISLVEVVYWIVARPCQPSPEPEEPEDMLTPVGGRQSPSMISTLGNLGV